MKKRFSSEDETEKSAFFRPGIANWVERGKGMRSVVGFFLIFCMAMELQ